MRRTDVAVLLVDDNDFDVKRVLRGFEKLGDTRAVKRARDGIEALEILRGEADSEKSTGPMVVMLDLNMPRMGGLEFLDEVRNDEQLCSTPVFVVTTSDFHQDIKAAHSRMISGYFVKPDTSDEMINVLKILSEYWDTAIYPN